MVDVLFEIFETLRGLLHRLEVLALVQLVAFIYSEWSCLPD